MSFTTPLPRFNGLTSSPSFFTLSALLELKNLTSGGIFFTPTLPNDPSFPLLASQLILLEALSKLGSDEEKRSADRIATAFVTLRQGVADSSTSGSADGMSLNPHHPQEHFDDAALEYPETYKLLTDVSKHCHAYDLNAIVKACYSLNTAGLTPNIITPESCYGEHKVLSSLVAGAGAQVIIHKTHGAALNQFFGGRLRQIIKPTLQVRDWATLPSNSVNIYSNPSRHTMVVFDNNALKSKKAVWLAQRLSLCGIRPVITSTVFKESAVGATDRTYPSIRDLEQYIRGNSPFEVLQRLPEAAHRDSDTQIRAEVRVLQRRDPDCRPCLVTADKYMILKCWGRETSAVFASRVPTKATSWPVNARDPVMKAIFNFRCI